MPLPCAKFLCREPLRRVHITCLWCRWRRKWIGKFTWGKMVNWYLPWTPLDEPEVIMIDQRGHGLMFRCCMIIVLVRTAFIVWKHSRKFQFKVRKQIEKLLMAPWMNAAECVADITFP